ncbi:hypothetical protein SY85_00315 [Flavisolibacter tropicus]|uniref:ASPIC/UnbV domain-containing protein n=1 Tax=Flavisolibacter tropicus TaxID=1492898 RepID=A0A172U234_9BACT|nr:hypothetical protein SY85_00315 [Flavisolibacter tropicus]
MFLYACSNESETTYVPPSDPLFSQMASGQTGIAFINKVTDDSSMNVFNYRNFYNGGGVAIGDINNDGLSDIYFTSNQQNNHLYLNKGNWAFTDITEKAGVGGQMAWSTGVTMADVNADGWLDIYVCNSGNIQGDKRKNELFINNHNNTFTEQAQQYNLADSGGYHTHAAFFDYDKDGDLDVYLLNNSYYPVDKITNRNIRNVRDPFAGDKLLRNDNGHFTDVSEQAGIYGSLIGFGLGVTIGDVNGDYWPDIYVSNDFFEKDYLYINQKNGTFKEDVDSCMEHTSQSSMGADLADINNDGWADIFSTDMLPESDERLKTTTRFDDFDFFNSKVKGSFHKQFLQNCLQLNNGNETFSEIAAFAGVNATDWSWGALLFDFDNDGWKDIFVSNGIYKDLTNQDYIDFLQSAATREKVIQAGRFDVAAFLDKLPSTPIPNYAFVNERNLQFANQSYTLGLGQPSFSNGAAYGDLDNDGDLDLVVNNVNQPAFIYRNNQERKAGNNYLRIKFKGSGQNTMGIGSQVKLWLGKEEIVYEQMLTRGFESSVDPVMCIGIGKAKVVDSMEVVWPNLKRQVLKGIRSNQTITLDQQHANQQAYPIPVGKALFSLAGSDLFSGDFLHHENAFIDFDRERLIPKMISTEGPKMAIGDVNGDGLEDVILGSAKEDSMKLFIQTGGRWKQSVQKAFERDKDYENIGLELADVDGDGDLDLLAASGGNEDVVGAYTLTPRLYLNDGKGNFSRSLDKLPSISVNVSCIRTVDVDNDGDLDVFIGGRSVPGMYGEIPQSYLLINDGKGVFKDVTSANAPALQKIGMVTDAKWVDFNGDGFKDLVVAGDWMPVMISINQHGILTEPRALSQSAGWWNTLTIADVDGDGDSDIIAGNQGLNSKIKVSPDKPGMLYIGDFDKNGQEECIPVYYKSDGKAYPFYLKGDLVQQLPSLKKKFLHYAAYAGKTMDEVLSPEQLKSAKQLKVEEFQTCLFINEGKSGFKKLPLPSVAQLAPVYSILVLDYNSDGNKDIIMGGNFFGLKPEVGRLDASYGVLLKGVGQGRFEFIPNLLSGLKVKDETRDIQLLKAANQKSYIVFARNNESIQIYKAN